MLVGNVLDEDVVTQVRHAAQVKFVAQAQHGTGFFVGPFLREFIAGAQLLNQQGGGDVRVDAPVHQVALEIASPGGGVVLVGILEGPLLGHGEMVVIFHAQLLALFHQPEEVVVNAVGGLNNVVVKDQVIAGTVAHQNIAVPIQDVATGGLHTGQGGIGGHIVGVALGFDDLQVEKLRAEKHEYQQKQAKENHGANLAYSLHTSPPIFWIRLIRGYRASITKKLSSQVSRNTPIRPQ